MTERLTLTADEVAWLLGVHKETVYRMSREKQIPHFRVRGRILFRREAIEKWISDLEQNSVERR